MHLVDGRDAFQSNWLRYVKCCRSPADQNIRAVQYDGNIYYMATKQIEVGDELLAFYGEKFARMLGIKVPKKTSSKEKGVYYFHPLGLTFNCRLVSSVARGLTCLPNRKTQVQSTTSWSNNQSFNNLVRSCRLWFKILSQFRWSRHWVVTLTKLWALYPSSFLINWKEVWKNEKNLKRVDVDLVVWSTFLMGEGTIISLQWPCQKLASLRIIAVPVCNWLRDTRVINEILFFVPVKYTCIVLIVGVTSYLQLPVSTIQGSLGGRTTIYGLYRYVPLWRVWF